MSREWAEVEFWRQHIIEGKAIAVIWTIDDIISEAESSDIELTEEQAKEILSLMSKNHDAEQGINWYVIRDWIDWYLSDKSGLP